MSNPTHDHSGLERIYTKRAIGLAESSIGLASPNPAVGCVLARGETLLGEGAHLYAARDHAEIAALQQAAAAGHNLHGATAHVTLEPCAHHSRTPPCADALIAAGITRCVVATIDPNPLVRGQGLAKLRAAGIEVHLLDPTSDLAQTARRLNDAFAFSIQHHRPFVTLKAALSADGYLAPPPHTRTTTEPHWLTGPAARADVQLLRHASDAILTGIGTVLADNPALTDRTKLPRRRPLLRVILDTHLRTPLDSQLVSTAASKTDHSDLLILCSEDPAQAPAEREAALRARGVEVLRVPSREGRLDLTSALNALAQRNILSLLVEAGSAVHGSLLSAGLVDKLVFYYAPRELGPDAIPFAEGFATPEALQQQLTRTTRAVFPNNSLPSTQDTRITGYLHDPWANIA